MPNLHRHPAASLILFLVCAQVFNSAYLLAHAETITIRDGGVERSFSLALDELDVVTPQGGRERLKVAPMTDRKAVAGEIKRQAAARSEPPRLVVYEVVRGKRRGEPKTITPDILVTFSTGANPDEVMKASGITAWRSTAAGPRIRVASAGDAASALDLTEQLRMLDGVESADPLLAKKRYRKFTPNDPSFPNQWHLLNTGQSGGTAGVDVKATNVWPFATGQGITIGIVDDGLDAGHPDLAAHVDTTLGRDFNFGDTDPSHDLPDDGHGTACAGVAAAVGNNGLGVSGVAQQATLVGLRLISLDTTDEDEADALNWRNDVIDIKSNSWGPFDDGETLEGPGPLLAAAFSNACMNGRGGRGTIITWAGGNGLAADDNSNFDGNANSIYTIAVGAVGHDGRQTQYGEPGANLLVCAPSAVDGDGLTGGIWTTDWSGPGGYSAGDYASDFSGTSSATPLVSGIVALMLEVNPLLGWRDVQEILARSASRNDPADAGWRRNPAGFWFNHKYGSGMVDADAAARLAATWTNLGPQLVVSAEDNGLNSSIPDDDATGVIHALSLTNDIRIEHAVLQVDISHSYRGDLHIELISPAGTTSELATVRSGDGGQDLDWSLMSLHHRGESSLGTWRVKVSDRAADDTGVLNGLGLLLYGTATTSPPPPPPPTEVELLVLADPADGGTVLGGGTFAVGSTQTITAVTSTDWQFDGWQDGNTDNPRTVVVGSNNVSFTAIFTNTVTPPPPPPPPPPPLEAEVLVLADPAEGGTVLGGGTFAVGSTQTISAVASTGWLFSGWQDGNTDNPRMVVVNSRNVSFTADFIRQIVEGQSSFSERWRSGVKKRYGEFEQVYKGRFSLKGKYALAGDGFTSGDLVATTTVRIAAGEFERVFTLDDNEVTLKTRNGKGRATYRELEGNKNILMITLKWNTKNIQAIIKCKDSALLEETILASGYAEAYAGEDGVKESVLGSLDAEFQLNDKLSAQSMSFSGKISNKIQTKYDEEFDLMTISINGKTSSN